MPDAKHALNARLAQRLRGETVAPTDPREGTIFALVDMIESQCPRAAFPELWDSLQAIHRAQERSLDLLRPAKSPWDADVLGISMEKGGTSVLADGYIVAGTLTAQQEEFVFGWGAFLQLADDLQDVRSDAHDGLATVFSVTARRWPLDALSTRALHFGRRVLDAAAPVAAPGAAPLVEMMVKSADLLLQDAIGAARGLHTRAYASDVERTFPFRYAALGRARRRMARQRVSFLRLIEAYASLPSDPPTQPL